jgi:hypothetical protein
MNCGLCHHNFTINFSFQNICTTCALDPMKCILKKNVSKLGIGLRQLNNIRHEKIINVGYFKTRTCHYLNKVYGINSLIDYIKKNKKKILDSPAKIKKFNKYMEKHEDDNKKFETLMNNIKLNTDKFTYELTFDDTEMKIIKKRYYEMKDNLNDPDLIAIIICDLEKHVSSNERSYNFINLINKGIPFEFRGECISSIECINYIDKGIVKINGNDVTAAEDVFKYILNKYEKMIQRMERKAKIIEKMNEIIAKHVIDNRQVSIKLRSMVVTNDRIKELYLPYLEGNTTIGESLSQVEKCIIPIIDKCNRAYILKIELLKYDLRI